MEAQTDIQTYMEQGKQALAQGQPRAAAIAYAHAAQLEPTQPMIHLGLAEANLGLGNYGVVQMACRRVQELQESGGIESMTAQALMDLLDRRYERVMQQVDRIIAEDPSIAYVHALRSYLFRIQSQDYDANLARARAARLSYGGHFDNCFPKVDPLYTQGYTGNNGYKNTIPSSVSEQTNDGAQGIPAREREQIPTWSQRNPMQRQMVRTRFALNRYPGLVTNILIVINVVVFMLQQIIPQVDDYGIQYNPAVVHGEYWRIFTAMFLHASMFHIAINMFSLFFIGRGVEFLFGHWRYLAIYLLSGIAGGVLFLFTSPGGAAVGASGAIFGIFGALGVFYIVNRRMPGGSGAITNWLLWLGINIVFGFTPGSGIAILDHAGGLIMGMILAFLLIPRRK